MRAASSFDLQSEGNTVKLYNDEGEAAGNGQSPSFGFGFDGEADRYRRAAKLNVLRAVQYE